MSVLVVGISHHSAGVDLLERVSVGPEATADVLELLLAQPSVSEAVVLSTCNRVEVYAAVRAFHGGLAEIGAVLADRAGQPVSELAPHLYVHYGSDAVRHCLRVASGLDSMVVGEAQILGQLRSAYAAAAEHDAAGRMLHELMQEALRVGKRVHAETGIDRAGQSVVSAALALAGRDSGPVTALVLGAGSMGSLAVATLAKQGAQVYVANRSAPRATRLAELHGATAVDFATSTTLLSTVDIVVCATASPELVLGTEVVAAAVALRPAGTPLALLDLAVPRDVEPSVAELDGVTLVDMNRLGEELLDQPSTSEREAAEAIVAAESEAYLTWLKGNEVAPTVAALRARADEVVEAELRRLAGRLPDLPDEQRAEVAHAIHRVVQQLLHSPTVRVRQLAATPDGDQYAAVLRELFDLQVDEEALRGGEELRRAVLVDSGQTTVDPAVADSAAVDGGEGR